MIIISAMAENRVIGRGDGMPWSIPEEYAQYLRFVRGQTVIMGRKTYQIFGADLPGGTNAIVISRTASFEDAAVVPSLDAALREAESFGREVFVAGGQAVYAEAIPLASAMYLSTIKGTFEGDTYFPVFDERDWEITQQRDEPEYVFRVYSRVAAA